MKIAYVDRSLWWGGAEESLAWLAAGMARRGHAVEIVVDFPQPHHARFAEAGLRVTPRMARLPGWAAERWRRPPRGLDRLGVLLRARWLRRHVAAEGVAVAHLNLFRDRARWDAEAARSGGAAVVGHLRQLWRQVPVSATALATCDAAVAVSEAVAAEARAAGRADVRMIYDGIDPARFGFAGERAEARRALGLPEDATVIGFPAALEPRKGQDTALAAFAEIAAVAPEAVLVLAGPEPRLAGAETYVAGLRRRAEGLGARVRFLGPCAEMGRFYAACDIVLALACDGEAFGRVAAEAAVAARPVVATRAGATAEVVADGETGILVAPGDVGATAAALAALVADPARAAAMGRAAAARARALFDPEAALDRFEALYRELAARR